MNRTKWWTIWATVLSVAAITWAASRDKEADRQPPKMSVQVDTQPLERQLTPSVSFAPVVKKAKSAVVNVFTTKTLPAAPQWGSRGFFDDPMFRRFFENPGDPMPWGRRPSSRQVRSLGSGVIVTADGYILTNDHVVDGADEVKVALGQNGKEYIAKVVGRDGRTDVAVLKIDADNLPHLVLGDSDQVEVGDLALAIGNPFGLSQTVTLGIVSALGRNRMGIEDYEDFIQVDAAINPGNSGGALVDLEGRLIGINTAILSRSGGNQGIGFAIPINLARQVMESLITNGKVARGFLGVGIQDLTPELASEFKAGEGGGALVTEVMPQSPAAKAGLQNGDVIVQIDGKPVSDSVRLRLLVGQTAPGTQITLKLVRQGKEKTVSLTLEEIPADLQTAQSDGRPAQDVLRGVVASDLTPAQRAQMRAPANLAGAVVTEVDPDSGAARAGIREGDVILEINRQPVRSASELEEACKQVKGERILLRIWNRGMTRFVMVVEGPEQK